MISLVRTVSTIVLCKRYKLTTITPSSRVLCRSPGSILLIQHLPHSPMEYVVQCRDTFTTSLDCLADQPPEVSKLIVTEVLMIVLSLPALVSPGSRICESLVPCLDNTTLIHTRQMNIEDSVIHRENDDFSSQNRYKQAKPTQITQKRA